MDKAKVLMLQVSSGLEDLPPDLEALAQKPEWWQNLAATPDESLNAEQRSMLRALGVSGLPEENSRSAPLPVSRRE